MPTFKDRTVGRANYTMRDYMMDVVWESMSAEEKYNLMKTASGLPNPTAVRHWESVPHDVFIYWSNHLDELKEMYEKVKK